MATRRFGNISRKILYVVLLFFLLVFKKRGIGNLREEKWGGGSKVEFLG